MSSCQQTERFAFFLGAEGHVCSGEEENISKALNIFGNLVRTSVYRQEESYLIVSYSVQNTGKGQRSTKDPSEKLALERRKPRLILTVDRASLFIFKTFNTSVARKKV